MFSFAPAAKMLGWFWSTARAGSFCLFSENGLVGLPELEPAERSLIKRILSFPEEVAEAATRRAPHRITTYALELAQEFTAFYRDCRIVEAEPPELESFRLALAVTARSMIARALGLLGVSAPEHM